MKKILCFMFAILCATQTHALAWEENAAVAQLFADAGVEGTFVLYDVSEDRYVGHSEVRAETRFTPASTFKIPNSLIALSTGAVSSVDEVLPYGGQPQPYPAWEHDMSMREAIKISNVPIYREVARRIGLERMQESVTRLDYGNGDIGDVVDRFWLDGPLAISAMEQTRFLAQLAKGELPFPKDAQQAVGDIARLETYADGALYGKTGWVHAPDPGVGWWVGWVTREDRVYAFAINIHIQTPDDAAKRMEIGKSALQILGVLNPEVL